MNQEIMQKCIIRTRVEFASQARARGDHKHAEMLCLSALRLAESVVGRLDPLTGHVLLELHELYDEQGMGDAKAKVWEQIRQIYMNKIGKANRAQNMTATCLVRQLLVMPEPAVSVR